MSPSQGLSCRRRRGLLLRIFEARGFLGVKTIWPGYRCGESDIPHLQSWIFQLVREATSFGGGIGGSTGVLFTRVEGRGLLNLGLAGFNRRWASGRQSEVGGGVWLASCGWVARWRRLWPRRPSGTR
jgi:hypothetical protein